MPSGYDPFEMIWFLASCILFAFSLVNWREAWLDLQAADETQEPAVRIVARSRATTEGVRSLMLAISVLASAIVYLSPNPPQPHTAAGFEIAILVALFAFVFGTGATTLISRRQRDVLAHLREGDNEPA